MLFMSHQPVLTKLSLCRLVLSAVHFVSLLCCSVIVLQFGGLSGAGGWFCSLSVVDVLVAVLPCGLLCPPPFTFCLLLLPGCMFQACIVAVSFSHRFGVFCWDQEGQ